MMFGSYSRQGFLCLESHRSRLIKRPRFRDLEMDAPVFIGFLFEMSVSGNDFY
jgi:hypothetical protein